MRKLALAAVFGIGVSFPVQASVIYSFVQTSFTPSPNASGPSGFVLRDTLLITDSEFAAGSVNRIGNGLNTPSYNLTIGSGGVLSGSVGGLLSDYNFNLAGQGGAFSGNLVYGDTFISDCQGPRGCSIGGLYARVPEPVSTVAFGAGLIGLAFARRRNAN